MTTQVTVTQRQQAAEQLTTIASRLIERGRGNFGFDRSYDKVVRDILLVHGIQNFRFEEIPSIVGDDAYFSSAKRRVLDFGCGTGPFVYGALAAGIETAGIDLDYEKIVMARLKVDAYGYPDEWRNAITLGSAYDLPYPSEHFDVVSSFQVLEHVDDLTAALYEAVRVTKRGGWLVLRAPDYRMSFEPHYRIPWPQFAPPRLAERWVMAMDKPPGGLGMFYYITLPQVAAILAALDCEIVVSRLDAVVSGRGYVPVSAPLATERIVIRSEAEAVVYAEHLKQQIAAGTLADPYHVELNFLVAARRR